MTAMNIFVAIMCIVVVGAVIMSLTGEKEAQEDVKEKKHSGKSRKDSQ